MSDTVIQVENLSKQYRLGIVGAKTIQDDLSRLWARIRGKEDPTLRIGQTNNLNSGLDKKTLNSKYVWALKDINFSVQQGEVLGIIGKNGAGKSTLLKILSKVTGPTTGNVKVKGRIASLLEVGTGFHPELSGRENIFLNGAILGMTKAEIRRKFDEIVDFSGVETYIDTPVKRYSSGMYVRLAFAVAAHMDPEILVVDEVLAVGDAEFQKKAIGKMRDISTGNGRTVLFVSHNMGAISQLCSSTLILTNGTLAYKGPTNSAIDQYLSNSKNSQIIRKDATLTNENQFIKFYNVDPDGTIKSDFKYDEPVGVLVKVYLPKWNPNLELAISLMDRYKKRIFTILEPLNSYYNNEKIMQFQITIPPKFITPGQYSWQICIILAGIQFFDLQDDVCGFTINETGSEFARYFGSDYGCVYANYKIKKQLGER